MAIGRGGHLGGVRGQADEDGGHMDLQALRYAAMVSSMTFDDVVRAYASFLATTRPGADINARSGLASFLGREDDEDLDISEDVRIVLISANFGREITTAVLWLNRFEGMDIRCMRLVPYSVGDRVMLDIQQIVPLPEAADYQVRVRRKAQERERARTDGRDFTRFHIVVDGELLPDENKRNAVRVMTAACSTAGSGCAIAVGPPIQGQMPADRGPEHFVPHPLGRLSTRFDRVAFYLDQLFHQGRRTWVLSKRWGATTEQTLQALEDAFPESGVVYRRADAG